MEPVGVQSDWSVPTASEQFRPVPGLSKPASTPASMEGHRPVVVPGVRQTSGSEVEQRARQSVERPRPLATAERLSLARPELNLKNRPVLRPSDLARGRKEEKKKGFFSRLFGLFKK
jgi:hypothetical protein